MHKEPRNGRLDRPVPDPGPLILLVEDQPECRDALLDMIGLAGHRADAAEDGLAALQQFTKGRYALVLTDLDTPRVDGFRLAAAIRAIERSQRRFRTPIIALAADAQRGQIDRCFESGMDDYVSKPLMLGALAEKLGQWLKRAPPRR